MKKKNIIIILTSFILLVVIFSLGLNKNPQELPSVLVGKPVPELGIQLPKKRFFLLNVWGSWCQACYQEHPFLMTLNKEIEIIGINWSADNPNENQDGAEFLKKYGNPYSQIVWDNGKIITDLGVYGAPETFLIADGKIIHRLAGVLNPEIWQEQFQKRIREFQ